MTDDQTSTNPSSAPPNPDTLPSEALDLAAKIFDLARSGSTRLLQTYVESGIPPNLTNSRGDTLLMLASYHGHTETASMLLSHGADPNACNDRGQSILAGAVFKGFDEVVKILINSGADKLAGQPNAVDCARMFKRDEALRIMGED